MRTDIDKGGRTSIMRADIVDGKKIRVDASPVNNGISGTLFVVRGGKKSVAKLFSVKLKDHQVGWLPCKYEALAIRSSINFFAPFIRESEHYTQVLTYSKACSLAYAKLSQGKFSASSRMWSVVRNRRSEHPC